MRYGFYYNQARCTGCDTCVVACKDYKMLKPGKAFLRKNRPIEQGSYMKGDFKRYNMVFSCNHCEEPMCIPACPVGAISQEPGSNIVKINRVSCQGHGECITACPYGAPQMPDDDQEPITLDPSTPTGGHRAIKCDACYERRQNGEQPVCVSACLMRALEWGPYDELVAKYGDNHVAVGFPVADTKPSIIIKVKQ